MNDEQMRHKVIQVPDIPYMFLVWYVGTHASVIAHLSLPSLGFLQLNICLNICLDHETFPKLPLFNNKIHMKWFL